MEDIDDSLYSRQRCVLGDDAMRKISRSKVFLLGLGGVGVEIAKNLVLGGVEELIIQDNTICSTTDLGTQFFIRESDIDRRKTRAEASLPHLIALNPYVRITMETRDLNGIRGALSDDCNAEILQALWKEDLAADQQIKCLIATQCLLNTAATLNLFCRKHNIWFIYTDVYGVFGNLFCDFGQTFVIRDPFGEPPKEFFIGHVEKVSANQLNVKVYGDRRHYLETGQMIRFSELCGMTELNDQTFVVAQVVSPSEFAINVDTDSLSPYTGGGMGTQVIVPQMESYESMLKQLREPTIVTTDLSRPDEGHVLHLMYLALSKFRQDKGRYPEPWDESDWALLKQDFHVLLDLFPDKVDIVNEDSIKRLAFVCKGQLAPLCAFFGAVAAQEAMKAVSGSFTPFKQWLYMQCDAVIPKDLNPEQLQLCQSRYDPLEICVGPQCVRGLQSLSAFLVGCGAIGCELLKNLALLGVATADHGQTVPGTLKDPLDLSASPTVHVAQNASSGIGVVSKTRNVSSLTSSPDQFDSLHHPTRYESFVTSSTTDRSTQVVHPSARPDAIGDVCTEEFVPFTSSLSSTTAQQSVLPAAGLCTQLYPASVVVGDHASVAAESSSVLLHRTGTQTVFAQSELNSRDTDPMSSNRSRSVHTERSTDYSTGWDEESAPKSKIPRSALITDECADSDTQFSTAVDPTEQTSTYPQSTPGVSSCAGADSDADSATAVRVQSRGTRAHLVVTDPDHIEKSNLNRQFLFRPEHIGQSKSRVAALAAQQINPRMDIRPMEQKISQSTEKTVFTDAFLLEATGSEAPNHQPDYQCTPLRKTGVVLAALDCVPSRRYLDQRCVSLQLPLFESGTLGTKGHVQVVLPGWTESYNSQSDEDSGAGDGNPGVGSIPYCTLKSFPSLPVHCVEWAREKFASQFTLKPNKLSQLMTSAGPNGPNWLVHLATELLGLSTSASASLTEVPREQEQKTDVEKRTQINWLRNLLTRSLARFLASRPTDWDGCVRLGRDKFERYFNHKARRLLHAFPPGTKLADGTPFWQLPKRQPTPLEFDAANPLHRLFVLSYARLLANQLQLSVPEIARGPIDQVAEGHVVQCLRDYIPPQFVPSKKRIVVDENEPAPPPPSGLDDDKEEDREEEASVPQAVPTTGGDAESSPISSSHSTLMLDEHTIQNLRLLIATLHEPDRVKVVCACRSVKFEKDDDNLAHVDFIAAAANLRATMYGLPVTPRHEVRRIAGRIVPAIATTTAAVAGLVSMELVKLIAAREQVRLTAEANLSGGGGAAAAPNAGTLQARNAFLNLALPAILLSEPGMCPKNRLPNGMEFTLWDMCVIPAPDNWDSYRLSDFLSEMKRRYDLQVAVVTQTNRMIYVSCLPMHKTRLNKPLKELLSYQAQDSHVDLMVAYDAGPNQDPDADYVRGPPVRLLLPTTFGSESMPPVLHD